MFYSFSIQLRFCCICAFWCSYCSSHGKEIDDCCGEGPAVLLTAVL